MPRYGKASNGLGPAALNLSYRVALTLSRSFRPLAAKYMSSTYKSGMMPGPKNSLGAGSDAVRPNPPGSGSTAKS